MVVRRVKWDNRFINLAIVCQILTYYVLSTILSSLYELIHLIHIRTLLGTGIIISPFLQIGKLRHREISKLSKMIQLVSGKSGILTHDV